MLFKTEWNLHETNVSLVLPNSYAIFLIKRAQSVNGYVWQHASKSTNDQLYIKKKMTNLYIVNICINENEKGDETRW